MERERNQNAVVLTYPGNPSPAEVERHTTTRRPFRSWRPEIVFDCEFPSAEAGARGRRQFLLHATVGPKYCSSRTLFPERD